MRLHSAIQRDGNAYVAIDRAMPVIGGVWIRFRPDLTIAEKHGAADLLTEPTIERMRERARAQFFYRDQRAADRQSGTRP